VNALTEERTKDLPYGERLYANGWRVVGFSITRDSDPLQESNFYTALASLAKLRGFEPTDVGYIGSGEYDFDAGDCPVGIVNFGHWAYGWVRELMVHVTDAGTCAEAQRMAEYVDFVYPVLNEEDYAERQHEADHPFDDRCYSDNDECPCGNLKA
jgi:hypothetical protein